MSARKEITTHQGEGFVRDKYETTIRELQTVLASGYLCLIIIGMIYEAAFYQPFSINIFEYAEILDFLLVPFRRPVTLLLLLGIIMLFYAVYYLDIISERKFPKFYRVMYFGLSSRTTKGFATYRIVAYIAMLVVYIGLSGLLLGEKIHEQLINERHPDIIIRYTASNKSVFRGKKIGKNGSYLFVMDLQDKVRIIPIDSHIQEIMPLAD